MMRKMYDNRQIIMSEKSDNDTLIQHVYAEGYVLVRDKPAISHLIYDDYLVRKRRWPQDDKRQCPFAAAKEPFLRRKRSFAYPLNSEINMIIDPE